MNRIKIPPIFLIVFVAAAFVLAYKFIYQKSSSAGQNLNETDQAPAATPAPKPPETNPFEKAKTNPFKDIKTNPFE